jgi:hypothetical protein
MIWNTGDRKRGIDAFLTTGPGTASSDEREARESLSRHTPGPREHAVVRRRSLSPSRVSSLIRTRADVASRIEAVQHFLPPPPNQTQGASMTSSIESFDKAIISRQPNFNERKTRSKFPQGHPESQDRGGSLLRSSGNRRDSARCRQGIARSDLSGRSLRVCGR